MNATGPADPAGPNPALMSVLTTEHYTLQSARASTIVEANGRSMLFLSSVSGATVALALVAPLDKMGDTFLTFALTVLPALLAVGLTSYSRLADLAVHDAYYARAKLRRSRRRGHRRCLGGCGRIRRHPPSALPFSPLARG